MDRLRRFARTPAFTAAIAYLGRTSQQLAAVAIVLIAAAFLSPAQYGVYSLAAAFAVLLQSLTYAGFYHFIVRQEDAAGTLLDTCFWCMMAAAVIGSCILIVVAPYLSYAFRAPYFVVALSVLAFDQVLGTPLAWISAVLIRREQLLSLYVIMIIESTVSLIVGVVLLFLWPSVFSLLVYRIAKTLISTALYFGYCRVFPGLKCSWSLSQIALRYAVGLYGSRFMTFLYFYSADIVLGIVFSTAEAGLFRFGNRVATGITDVITQPINNFALTQFGAAQRRGEGFFAIYARFASTTLMLLGITCIAVALLVEPAVHAFLAPSFFGAIGVTHALCVARAFALGGMFAEPILSARGNTTPHFLYSTAAVVIAVAAVILAAPLGLLAVAWAQAMAMMLAGILGLAVISRYMSTPLWVLVKPLTRTLPHLGAFAVGAFAIRSGVELAIPAGLAEVVIAVVLTGLLAIGSLWVGLRTGVVSMSVFADRSSS